jgi:hypothetical protein
VKKSKERKVNDTEELVGDYLEIRRMRESLKATYESQDEELKDAMESIKEALLAICNENNQNGFKTHSGTVTRQVKDRFFCTDWDNFKKFIELEGSIDLLERRIHQRNFKEFMSERVGDGLPPGVNALREYDIVVRKASSTSETLV